MGSHRRRALLVAAFAPLLGGCAATPTADADRAQLADVVSTGISVANGLEEANPLVEPLVSGGPIGLIGLSSVKLGLNRLAPRQSPANCRALLSVSTAVGWGAVANNLAMLIAPPLAMVAVPVALRTYNSAWRGSALRTCSRMQARAETGAGAQRGEVRLE